VQSVSNVAGIGGTSALEADTDSNFITVSKGFKEFNLPIPIQLAAMTIKTITAWLNE